MKYISLENDIHRSLKMV